MKSFFLPRVNKVISIILPLIFLNFFQGCMFYYKVETVNKINRSDIKKFDSLDKYLIIHNGDSAWHLSGTGSTDSSFSGNLSILPAQHLKYKSTKTDEGNRYKFTDEQDESCVLKEVHLYIPDSLHSGRKAGDSVKMAYKEIRKAEIYSKDKSKTTTSWVLPAVLVPVLGFPTLVLIIMAISGGSGDVSMGM